MRKQCVRFLITLIGVAGFGFATKAQSPEQVVVNIPYEFVVAGKTFPAGTYTVARLSINNPWALILSSPETHASALVFATHVERAHNDQPKLGFEEKGSEHSLSRIETTNRSFTIPVTRSQTLETAMKSHKGSSAAETSGDGNR